MKFDAKTTMGALALLLLGYALAKRSASADPAAAVVPSQASSQAQSTADWWTFAGSWHM